jgi:hypothetical protein
LKGLALKARSTVPKYWAATRARLDAGELARPLRHITVPPPAEQQRTPS